jgi:hypothetical protein
MCHRKNSPTVVKWLRGNPEVMGEFWDEMRKGVERIPLPHPLVEVGIQDLTILVKSSD